LDFIEFFEFFFGFSWIFLNYLHFLEFSWIIWIFLNFFEFFEFSSIILNFSWIIWIFLNYLHFLELFWFSWIFLNYLNFLELFAFSWIIWIFLNYSDFFELFWFSSPRGTSHLSRWQSPKAKKSASGASAKMPNCGHQNSRLLQKWTWVDLPDHFSYYEGKDIRAAVRPSSGFCMMLRKVFLLAIVQLVSKIRRSSYCTYKYLLFVIQSSMYTRFCITYTKLSYYIYKGFYCH
jgi:hypothetical protein